jgi:hypothetical protein
VACKPGLRDLARPGDHPRGMRLDGLLRHFVTAAIAADLRRASAELPSDHPALADVQLALRAAG